MMMKLDNPKRWFPPSSDLRLNLVGFNYPREFMSALSSGPFVFPSIDVFNDSREVKWGNRAWKCASQCPENWWLCFSAWGDWQITRKYFRCLISYCSRSEMGYSRGQKPSIDSGSSQSIVFWERTYGSVFEPEDDEPNVLNIRCDKWVWGLARP